MQMKPTHRTANGVDPHEYERNCFSAVFSSRISAFHFRIRQVGELLTLPSLAVCTS